MKGIKVGNEPPKDPKGMGARKAQKGKVVTRGEGARTNAKPSGVPKKDSMGRARGKTQKGK